MSFIFDMGKVETFGELVDFNVGAIDITEKGTVKANIEVECKLPPFDVKVSDSVPEDEAWLFQGDKKIGVLKKEGDEYKYIKVNPDGQQSS